MHNARFNARLICQGLLRTNLATSTSLAGQTNEKLAGSRDYFWNSDSVESLAVVQSIDANYKGPSKLNISSLQPVSTPIEALKRSQFAPNYLEQYASEEEMKTVCQRLDTCLGAANMTEDFRRNGYLEKARENARHYVNVLRSIIPTSEMFSKNYSSPCWETEFRVSNTKERGKVLSKIGGKNILLNQGDYSGSPRRVLESIQQRDRGEFASNVACLPKIFVAGFPKCGTTFLYCLITKGLGIRPMQMLKEPHWWVNAGPLINPWKPATKDVMVYLLNFIASTFDARALTVDASVETILEWPRFYRGEPPVNYCLIPALIPKILPTSKYIVTMRNPVLMLYSYFWFSCTQYGIKLSKEERLKAPDVFHDRVVSKVKAFNSCLRSESLEWCTVYISNLTSILQFSPELPRCGRIWLGKGLYYVHIKRWLSVVPRENFYFVKMEEMSRDTGKVAKELWDFLEVPGDLKLYHVNKCQSLQHEQKAVNYHHDPHLEMRRDTKELLEEFYRPFNQRLADLIADGNSKFLWEDT